VAVNEVSDPSGGSTDKAIGALYVGLAVSVAAWIYSIADSQKAARRTNAKNGLVFMDKIQVSPTMVTTNTNQHGYGMTMRINF
jgi:nicotinamide mononucleotide (NMN) deamidase PncC